MDGQSHAGDGASRNPFGNGKGATEKMGPSGGNVDFTKNPDGGASKEAAANDFTKNPAGKGSKAAGKDPAKDPGPAQKSGPAPDLSNDGSPGEKFYKADPRPGTPDVGTGTLGNSHKPFRLK